MPTVVEMMAQAAQGSHCSHKSFSQMAAIANAGLGDGQGNNGICHGLAIVWLEQKAKASSMPGTRTSTSFLSNVTTGNPQSDVFSRSQLIWQNQRSINWQALTGLKPSKDGGGEAQEKVFLAPDELDDFCSWLCAANGERYFLVGVQGHTMAAVGSRLGLIQFFDPNGGIVSSRFKSQMVACLTTYFANNLLKVNYRNKVTNQFNLTVSKFK